jgi:transcriptional regulator
MYRPAAFASDEVVALHKAIRARVFATVACEIDGFIEFAYAPVVLDATDGSCGGVRFHLAGNNPVAGVAERTRLVLSFLGPDAYVSPDWYDAKDRVPTWNYIAIEGRGVAHRLREDELRKLLIDLSAEEENNLLPKTPWTIDKLPQDKMASLMKAIVGFSVRFETLEGKFKLSQNVTPEDAEGVISGLIRSGGAASRAVAREMRKTR